MILTRINNRGTRQRNSLASSWLLLTYLAYGSGLQMNSVFLKKVKHDVFWVRFATYWSWQAVTWESRTATSMAVGELGERVAIVKPRGGRVIIALYDVIWPCTPSPTQITILHQTGDAPHWSPEHKETISQVSNCLVTLVFSHVLK